MHKYKLVALDLDETLLTPDSLLSDYTIETLRQIEKTGIKVVLCTGRLYEGARPYAQSLGIDNPGVFCNGAQIRKALSGDILHECPLSIEHACEAIRLGQECGGHPRVYMDDRIYVPELLEKDQAYSKWTSVKVEAVGDLCSFLAKAPLKLINVMPDAEAIPVLVEKSARFFGDNLYITQSLGTFVEYMNAGATKGKGIKRLAEMWGIGKEEIIAAGDHLNDLPLFAEAGLSIAPANAQPAVRAAATVVCAGNDEDGVARKLSAVLL